ncbi:MAG: hypothetical protein FJ009_11245 [Chloroflexi bacterium]|nr:hypothetical protein [Chloroflexota bacterium]
MANISPDLKSKLRRDPSATVHLIVRLKDAPTVRLNDVRALGLTIRRTYTLIPAIAIQGSASASLTLAKKSWVLSLEEDKPVHTMSSR